MSKLPHMIGIAGGSCSGKTALAKRIAGRLPSGDVVILGLDSYYLDRPFEEDAPTNFDNPDALDKDLLVAQLETLARGKGVDKPVYDYITHSRLPRVERIHPGRFTIIEGLFVLYWEEVRKLLNTKIFIIANHKVCLQRRIERDTKERGRTMQSITRQYNETVRPMYEQHVHVTREHADLVVNGLDSLDDLTDSVLSYLANQL